MGRRALGRLPAPLAPLLAGLRRAVAGAADLERLVAALQRLSPPVVPEGRDVLAVAQALVTYRNRAEAHADGRLSTETQAENAAALLAGLVAAWENAPPVGTYRVVVPYRQVPAGADVLVDLAVMHGQAAVWGAGPCAFGARPARGTHRNPRRGEALAIQREIGDVRGEAASLTWMASSLVQRGALRRARSLLEQALPLVRELGRDKHGHVLLTLANIDHEEGAFDAAAVHWAAARRRADAARARGPTTPEHPDGLPSAAERSDDVRFALRMLDRACLRRLGPGV